MDQFLVEYAEKINKVLESGLLLKEISRDNADLVAQQIQDVKGNARPLDHMFGKDNNRIFIPFQGQIGEELRKLERKIENLASDEINVDVGRGLILRTIETRVGPKETELKIGKFLAKSVDDVTKLIEDFQALEEASETQYAKTAEQIRKRIERLSKDWSNGSLEWKKHLANPQPSSASFYGNVKKVFVKYLETWNAYSSARADATIIVTRHPMDILRMADHTAWKSCHSEDRGYFSCVIAEVEEDAGAVAYIVKNQDLQKIEGLDKQWDEIFVDWNRKIEGIAPSARLRLRTFQHDKTNQYLAIPEDSVYTSHEKGIPNFFSTVKVWTQETQMNAINEIFWSGPDDVYEIDLEEFTLMGGDYVDRGDNPAAVRAIFGEYFDRAKVDGEVKKSEGSLEAVVFDRMERLREALKNYIYQWHNVEDVPNSPRVIKIGLLSKIDFERRGFSLIDSEQSQDKAIWESIYNSTFRSRYSINLTAKHELSNGIYYTEDEFEDTASLRNLTKLEMSIRDLDEKYDELVNRFIMRLSNANLIKKAPKEKEIEKQGQKTDMLSMFGKGPTPRPDNSEEEVITEISRGVAANIAHKIQDIVERDRPLDFMFGKGINRILMPADLENPQIEDLRDKISEVLGHGIKIDMKKGVIRSTIETQRGPKEVEQKIGKALTKVISQLEKIKSGLDQEVFDERLKADIQDRISKFQKDWRVDSLHPSRKSRLDLTISQGETSPYIETTSRRIGEDIAGLRSILDEWVHQAGANTSGVTLLITRHPMDIVRMSDHSAWTSCHAEKGGLFNCVIEEVEDDAGALAYIIKSSDAEGLKTLSSQEFQWGEVFVDKSRGVEGIAPTARIRMRTFFHEDSDTYLVLPEDSTHSPLKYNVPGLFEFTKEWALSKQEDQLEEIFQTSDLEEIDEVTVSDFKLMGGHYVDRGDDPAALARIFEEFFVHSEVESHDLNNLLSDGVEEGRGDLNYYYIDEAYVEYEGDYYRLHVEAHAELQIERTNYTPISSEALEDNREEIMELWEHVVEGYSGDVRVSGYAESRPGKFIFGVTLEAEASEETVIDALATVQMLDNDFEKESKVFFDLLVDRGWLKDKEEKGSKLHLNHFKRSRDERMKRPVVAYTAPFVVDFLNIEGFWLNQDPAEATYFASDILKEVVTRRLERYARDRSLTNHPNLPLGSSAKMPFMKEKWYSDIKEYVLGTVRVRINNEKGQVSHLPNSSGRAFADLSLELVVWDRTGLIPEEFEMVLKVVDENFAAVVSEVSRSFQAVNLKNIKALQPIFKELPKTEEEWKNWETQTPGDIGSGHRPFMVSKRNRVSWPMIQDVWNKLGSLISK